MNKIFLKKNVVIVCPENRVDNYIAYCGHVFNLEKIKFIKKIKLLDKNNHTLILDQKKLIEDEFHLLFNKRIKYIIILLWNGDRDFFIYKKKIISLKKKFNVKLLSHSNFSRNIYFPLNNFQIKNKSTLRLISGISLLKKVKFNYPLIYGIYNFLKYFKSSFNFFLDEKLVFVGIGNKRDALNQLLTVKKNNYSKKINKICEILIKNIKKYNYNQYYKSFYEIFNSKDYQNIPIPIKYFLTQVSIRFLILSHLLKFKNFYHKNNSSFPLDLLRTNIYKKLHHLELGSQSGNTSTTTRKIYLKKFFHNKFEEISVFKNKENYNNKKLFKTRFDKFYNKLKKFNDYKNYSASSSELIIQLKKLNSNNLVK